MHWQASSRSEFQRKPAFTGAVWLVLLAMLLPGFASPRGLCCEAPHTTAASCCPDFLQMTAMDGHSLAGTVARCGPAPAAGLPDFVITTQRPSTQKLSPARDEVLALAESGSAGLLSAGKYPPFLTAKTPRRLAPFDPLSVS